MPRFSLIVAAILSSLSISFSSSHRLHGPVRRPHRFSPRHDRIMQRFLSHRTRISLGSHSITAGNAQDRTVLGAPGDTVALAWSYLYSSGIPSANDQATDLAIDSHDGSVYVAGSSYSATTGFDILIVKFTSGGDTIWTRRFNGRGNGDDYTAAIGVDSSGNVIVVGSSAAVDTTDDFVTLKYSPAGILLWTRYYDGRINEYDDPADLVIDNANNI